MKIFFMGLFLIAVVAVGFIKLTDRMCEKQFSAEFMQTAEYQAMQCK